MGNLAEVMAKLDERAATSSAVEGVNLAETYVRVKLFGRDFTF